MRSRFDWTLDEVQALHLRLDEAVRRELAALSDVARASNAGPMVSSAASLA